MVAILQAPSFLVLIHVRYHLQDDEDNTECPDGDSVWNYGLEPTNYASGRINFQFISGVLVQFHTGLGHIRELQLARGLYSALKKRILEINMCTAIKSQVCFLEKTS